MKPPWTQYWFTCQNPQKNGTFSWDKMSSSIFQRRTGDLWLCWWWACICTLFGFDLLMYRKWLESFVYPPSHQHHFPFAFAAVGNQTSVSAWVIDSCFSWAKLCAFTRDAFNGLINRYKKMLDLVKGKKKKITAKSLCTVDLLQLISVSVH